MNLNLFYFYELSAWSGGDNSQQDASVGGNSLYAHKIYLFLDDVCFFGVSILI